jgi:hypothetical protein
VRHKAIAETVYLDHSQTHYHQGDG